MSVRAQLCQSHYFSTTPTCRISPLKTLKWLPILRVADQTTVVIYLGSFYFYFILYIYFLQFVESLRLTPLRVLWGRLFRLYGRVAAGRKVE